MKISFKLSKKITIKTIVTLGIIRGFLKSLSFVGSVHFNQFQTIFLTLILS